MPETVVGRESELATIDAFVATAADGACALVIGGEPGIGKTTLWRVAVDRGGAIASAVLETRPLRTDARSSFTGLADLLRDIDRRVLDDLPRTQAFAVDVVCQRADPGSRSVDHQAISAAVLSIFTALGRDGPVVVAIDDVQWLDRPSQRVLESAARRVPSVPVSFVVAVRTQLGSDPQPLSLEVSLGAARVVRIDLNGLEAAALELLLAERLGTNLPRSLLQKIEETSGGNPMFAVDIARSLPPDWVPTGRLPVPGSVFDLASARVRRLPAVARRALLAAASLGEPRTSAVIEASGDPSDVVLAGLEAAEEARFVAVDETVRFTHPIFADVVYAAARTGERRAMHRRLADLVSDVEERARHLALATVGPHETVAHELSAAARRAAAKGAPDTALDFALLAIRFTPADDTEIISERTLRAAEYAYRVGAIAQVRELLGPLLASDMTPATRAEAVRLLAQTRFLEGSVGEAISLYSEAIEHARGLPRLTAIIELDLAFANVSTGDFAATEPHARRALAAAEEADEPAIVAQAEGVKAMVEFLLGKGFDEQAVDRSLALEDMEVDTALQMRPSLLAGYLYLYQARFDEARALLTVLEQHQVDHGDIADLPFLHGYLCFLETWAGNLSAAGVYAHKATTGAVGSTHEAFAYAFSAFMHAWAGDRPACERDASRAEVAARESGYAIALFWSRWARALLDLAEDRPRAAREALGELVDLIEAYGTIEPIRLPFTSDAIEALVGVRQLETAEGYLAGLEAAAVRLNRGWARLAAARSRAALFTARGDPKSAIATADQALADEALAALPWEQGRLLLAKGRALRALRRRREAADVYAEAEARFAERRALSWARRATAERERLGLQHRKGELTPSEREVARLAASGATNQSVAQALTISPKTVEVALARVYEKLGIHSRAELGARHASFERVEQDPSVDRDSS